LVAIPVLSTCGGSEGGDDSPAALKVVLAPPANVQIGTTFPLEIQVVTASGSPVEAGAVPVTMEVTGGGRTLTGETTVATDAEGVAQFTGIAVTGTVGTFTLTATAPELAQAVTGSIMLTAGAPATIVIVTGDSQVTAVARSSDETRRVRVRDAQGNDVAGQPLVLTVTEGAGSLDYANGVTTRQVVTDSSGIATVGMWRMGNIVGVNRLSVAVQGEAGGPTVEFSARSTAGPLHYPLLTRLMPATPHLATTYPAPFKVVTTDAFGNPIAGAQVDFTSTGGLPITVYGGNGVTDSTGTFVPDSIRTDTVAGVYSLHVTYTYVPKDDGVQNDVVLATPADPFSRIVALTPELDLLRSTTTQIQYRTVDRFGNAVAQVHVDGTIVSGGGTFAVGGESQSTGDYKPSLTAQATAGDVVVRVWSPLVPDSTTDVTVHVRAPTGLVSIGPDSQVVTEGDSLGTAFQVKVIDANGDPVGGVPVAILAGAHIPALTRVTDSTGLAGFRFAPGVGAYRVSAKLVSPWVGGDTVSWMVRSIPGAPHHLQAEGAPITTTVGDTLAVGPRVSVRDKVGVRVGGVVVHFATSRGTIAVADVVTDSLGEASVTGWAMDTVAGIQTSTATVAGLTPLLLSVNAKVGPAFSLIKLSPGDPEGFIGERAGRGLRVEARDRFGNLAVGRQVTLSVIGGDAISLGETLTIPANGRVYVDGWILGLSLTGATVRVYADSAHLDAAVTARPLSPFAIVVRGVTPEYAGYFREAAYQWRRRITADIPDLTLSLPGGLCAPFQLPYTGTIDDLIIDVSIGPIDGPGAILGGATPCFIRTASKLPLLGVMQFDDADLAVLEADGTLGDVITHEMGHVLGIGSLWSTDSVVAGAGTSNPVYKGAGGIAGWATIGGGATGSTFPLIENSGGPGTADVHWREATVPSELMTGYLSAAVNPMSALTIKSLTDLGYTVNASSADPYTVFTAPPAAPGGHRPVRIHDLVGRPKFEIDRSGRVKPIP
jgi:hypothetical protein